MIFSAFHPSSVTQSNEKFSKQKKKRKQKLTLFPFNGQICLNVWLFDLNRIQILVKMIFSNDLFVKSIETNVRELVARVASMRLEKVKLDKSIDLIVKYVEHFKTETASQPIESDDKEFVYFFVNFFKIKKLNDLIVETIQCKAFIHQFCEFNINKLTALTSQLDLVAVDFELSESYDKILLINNLKLEIRLINSALNDFVRYESKLHDLLYDVHEKVVSYFDEYFSKQRLTMISLLNLRENKINSMRTELEALKRCDCFSDEVDRLEDELWTKCKEIVDKTELIDLILPNENECLYYAFHLLNSLTRALDEIEVKLSDLKAKIEDQEILELNHLLSSSSTSLSCDSTNDQSHGNSEQSSNVEANSASVSSNFIRSLNSSKNTLFNESNEPESTIFDLSDRTVIDCNETMLSKSPNRSAFGSSKYIHKEHLLPNGLLDEPPDNLTNSKSDVSTFNELRSDQSQSNDSPSNESPVDESSSSRFTSCKLPLDMLNNWICRPNGPTDTSISNESIFATSDKFIFRSINGEERLSSSKSSATKQPAAKLAFNNTTPSQSNNSASNSSNQSTPKSTSSQPNKTTSQLTFNKFTIRPNEPPVHRPVRKSADAADQHLSFENKRLNDLFIKNELTVQSAIASQSKKNNKSSKARRSDGKENQANNKKSRKQRANDRNAKLGQLTCQYKRSANYIK